MEMDVFSDITFYKYNLKIKENVILQNLSQALTICPKCCNMHLEIKNHEKEKCYKFNKISF